MNFRDQLADARDALVTACMSGRPGLGELEGILKKPVGHLWLCVQHVPSPSRANALSNAIS